MRVSELYSRAAARGADALRLEDSLDCDDPKAALVALIIGHESVADGRSNTHEDEMEALREELRRLRFSALYSRAVSEGLATE
eukprot:COSAG06_NODE_37742_length_431_cov_1.545181_1_plen_82_part_10